jgi:NAD(P)-dependent dehydrogenase (short-subunit alcohol dehydrogenase family)
MRKAHKSISKSRLAGKARHARIPLNCLNFKQGGKKQMRRGFCAPGAQLFTDLFTEYVHSREAGKQGSRAAVGQNFPAARHVGRRCGMKGAACLAFHAFHGGFAMPEHDKDQNSLPPQHQDHQPGLEKEMTPRPESAGRSYLAAGKLKGKVALITGGDSGIGRAVAVLFAKEGANVVISYLDEHEDAKETRRLIEQEGRECIALAGDVADSGFCRHIVDSTVSRFGRLDILVNNAAQQYPQESIEKITDEQLDKTFRVNIFAMFYTVRAALPHLKPGARIINTTSVTAYRGSAHLLDYSATKGAIVAFTRSLSQQLIERGILVNGVAPGPIWTPLIPATFDAEQVAKFGQSAPLGRPGQPDEVAPAYVYLASEDSSYTTGQVLHPNGGEVVNA